MSLQLFQVENVTDDVRNQLVAINDGKVKNGTFFVLKSLNFCSLHLLVSSSFHGIWINIYRVQFLSLLVPGSAWEDYHGAEEKETYRIQVNPKPSAILWGSLLLGYWAGECWCHLVP